MSILLNTVTITSVALGAPPAVSTLNQNFPNPFNPRTTVAFTLARGGPVQLFVFDVSGRLITRLVDGTLTAGPHEVVWSGLTHEGQTVASGVYYYRLQAPGFVRSRKMVLLK